MGTRRVNARLPEELVTQADAAAAATHKDRTEVITEALRQYLTDKGSDEDFREAIVELYLADEIDFEQLAAVIGQQDAEAVRSSKQLVDRGEDIVDDLTEL